MIRYGRFLGLFTTRADRSRLRRPRLDGAEPLERRSMLAGDVSTLAGGSLIDGVLTFDGTESGDVISVTAAKVGGEAAIRVRGPDLPRKGAVFTGVEAVVIRSLGGNDRVVIGSGLRTASGGRVAVTVDAGGGSDVVVGGDGDETILGGDGDDNLRGGKGNDSIDGGGDKDRVNGDDGNDLLIGGGGDDELIGGKGNDSIYGGRGKDRLLGGVGDDDLDGGRDDGGRDDDQLLGGRGNDDDVDDDDSLDDMSPDPRNEDRGDNSNDDEDENEDDDDDDGDFDEEDEGEDDDDDDGDGDDNPGTVTPLSFVSGVATASGSSLNREDRKFFSFTLAAATTVDVTMSNVDEGRYPDLEIERQGVGAEVERELEPSEGGPTSGTFTLPAGTYWLRLRSPDLLPVNFSVGLVCPS